MKRSERLFLKSRYLFALAALTFGAAICAGAWAVRAWQSHPAGGLAVGFLALTALTLAVNFMLEAARVLRLHMLEERLEWEREVRPRL